MKNTTARTTRVDTKESASASAIQPRFGQ